MDTPKIHFDPDFKTNGMMAQHSAEYKRPTVREFRNLSNAAIRDRSPAKTWAAAWSLIRRHQAKQARIWNDVAVFADELPAAGLDRLAAFRMQCDARMAGGAA